MDCNGEQQACKMGIAIAAMSRVLWSGSSWAQCWGCFDQAVVLIRLGLFDQAVVWHAYRIVT
jgi:hypothetical protein